MIYTKKEFKQKWDSDENGGGITFDDIADCAKAWGLFTRPKCNRMDVVANSVTTVAGCEEVFELWE